VAKLVAFVEGSQRGIIPGAHRAEPGRDDPESEERVW